jgi:hypothetical protein
MRAGSLFRGIGIRALVEGVQHDDEFAALRCGSAASQAGRSAAGSESTLSNCLVSSRQTVTGGGRAAGEAVDQVADAVRRFERDRAGGLRRHRSIADARSLPRAGRIRRTRNRCPSHRRSR